MGKFLAAIGATIAAIALTLCALPQMFAEIWRELYDNFR